MLKKIIIFLVRSKLGLKRYEFFRFEGQKSSAVYYFTEDSIIKSLNNKITPSSVSLNWLLNEDCKIEKMGDILKWL